MRSIKTYFLLKFVSVVGSAATIAEVSHKENHLVAP